MNPKIAHQAEAGKDAGRIAVFAAVATIVTYFLDRYVPGIPPEVNGAIVVLIIAGLTYADSLLHHAGSKVKMPF